MIQRRSGLFLAATALLLLTPPPGALGAPIQAGLLPADGALSGPPGSTVGWGYSLLNDSLTDWFVPTGVASDSFANGTPSLLFDFPIVAPSTGISVPFDAGNGTGLYSLTWDAGAPPGFVNSGTFVLSGEWWDGDPFNGGNFLFSEPDVNLAYSATVTEDANLPEPSTGWLCLGACLLALWCRPVRAS